MKSDSVVLHSLCLCSKRLLPISLRTLYRDIIITDLDSEGPPGRIRLEPCRASQVFTTLARLNTSLARYVRNFYLAPSGSFWSVSKHNRSNVREDFIASLKLMVNLKHLSIHISDGEMTWNALRCCTSNQLESLSVSLFSMCRDVELPLGQHRLKQLQLRIPSYAAFPYIQLSHLAVVGGDARTIEHILPNTSISSLFWTRSSGDFITLTPALIHGFNNLHTLCIESSYYWNIKFLAPHLQRLRVLHFTRDGECFVNFKAELDDVPLLRGLHTFIYSDQNKYKLGYFSMSERARAKNLKAIKIDAKPLVLEWFRQLPCFQAAYFQVGNALREERSFLVWEQDRRCYRMAEGSEVWNISPWR